MTRPLYLNFSAIDDLRAFSEVVADLSGSEDLGEAFSQRLVDRCRRLAILPRILGTARPELRNGLRSTPHKDYVIFFRYIDDALEVIHILHGSRDLQSYFTDGDSADESA